MAVGGFVLYDFISLQRASESRVDRAAHLGGAAFGVLSYLLLRRRF